MNAEPREQLPLNQRPTPDLVQFGKDYLDDPTATIEQLVAGEWVDIGRRNLRELDWDDAYRVKKS